MWIKFPNGDVRNLDSGHSFRIEEERDFRGVPRFNIVSSSGRVGAQPDRIAEGYESKEAVNEALVSLLASFDIQTVDAPTPDDETNSVDNTDEEEAK